MKNANRLFRTKDLCAISGYAPSTIYAKINPKSPYYDPSFPKPRKLGPRLNIWDPSPVLKYFGKI